MEISLPELLQKMEEGWELRDHGTGWYIHKPRKAYDPSVSLYVGEDVVNLGIELGYLKTSLPHNVAIGELNK